MRKIFTRLATLVLLLVVMVGFSACSLFTVDLDKKYSADIMVATAENDDLTVSRQELYYGYLEWGQQYAGQLETAELLEYVTSALLNNKILERKSLEKFGDLRESEQALALKQAYQSLDTTIRAYVYEALNMEDEGADDNSGEDETEVDKPYQPSILVGWENGERIFTMDLSGYADDEGLGIMSLAGYEFYVPTIPGVATQKNAKQAISKIVRNLQSLENGFTDLKVPERDYLDQDNIYFQHLTANERAVLNREIDRMVRSNRTTIAVNRLNVAYNLGFFTLDGEDAKTAWNDYLTRGENFAEWTAMINGDPESDDNTKSYVGCGRTVATNIAEEAISHYITKVSNAINNQKNFPNSDLESSVMSSGLADVYYLPNDVAKNLYTVSHILIGFTDEQKSEYERIQKEAENNPAYLKQNELNDLYAQTSSNGLTAHEILIELQTALDNASTLEEKYDIFRDYINKYNTDPGMQNLDQLNSQTNKPQFEYLMSSDATKSQMVEPFTNASIELFNEGTGEEGEISGLVWTDYGAHIIMYTRNIADFIYTGVAGLEDTSVDLLKLDYADTLFASLTSYGNRTRFDTIVDTYFMRNYNNYQTFMLNDYRKDHDVTIVTSEFKNFF